MSNRKGIHFQGKLEKGGFYKDLEPVSFSGCDPNKNSRRKLANIEKGLRVLYLNEIKFY